MRPSGRHRAGLDAADARDLGPHRQDGGVREIPGDHHLAVYPSEVERQSCRLLEQTLFDILGLIEEIGVGVAAADRQQIQDTLDSRAQASNHAVG